jgi:carbonic anhydrase
LQGHTHSPSEHTFGGGFFDGELHLVHKSSGGKLLVLGILFEADDGVIASGSSQSMLSIMWKAAADAYQTATKATTSVISSTAITFEWDVMAASAMDFYRGFLPPSRAYWTYSGSLTTYPCTEGVTWIIFEQPVRISSNDLMLLRNSVKGNTNTIIDPAGNDNRPIQSLNKRAIRRYNGIDPAQTAAPTMTPTLPASSVAATVAAALANNGAAVQTTLAAAGFPDVQVSNPVVTTR